MLLGLVPYILSYNVYHYTKIIVVRVCVRACMRTYVQEVTGSDSKKFSFSASPDLGRYNRQPTDIAGYGPADAKVSCFKKKTKKRQGRIRLNCTLIYGGLENAKG